MPYFEIQDSVAFVTGTNKPNGIGRAIVNALLANGAKKVYATARDASQLEEIVASSEGRVIAVSLDVTDLDSIAKLADKYPDVNLVVNNAGYFSEKSTLDEIRYAQSEIAINYIAPLAIVQSFSPVLSKAATTADDVKGSAVVNVASIASFVNFPLGATYSASKAAAHSLTQGQRRDLSNSSLVIGVYPGPIETDMVARISMDKTPPSAVAKAVIEALKTGEEDVFPDPMALSLHEGWKTDAKALERNNMAQPQPVGAQ
jgi:NAD(P)-dependent dehydrogenase (short-subunit alcohol dehydrogenase family)